MAEGITRTHWSIGAVIEYEREAALSEFDSQLPGKRTRDELLALWVRQVVQTIRHYREGRFSIHTQVLGIKRQDDIQRFEMYTTQALGGREDVHNI